MKLTFKNFLTFLLSLTLVFSALSVCNISVFADDGDTNVGFDPSPDVPPQEYTGEFTYTVNKDNLSCTITKYTVSGFVDNLKIPSELDGYNVTAIGEKAFNSCRYIRNVQIPIGVTAIGANAFASCANLKTVVLPDTVTTIDRMAFYYNIQLSAVNIPDGVTDIGESAFMSCKELKNIDIPVSVTNIGDSAFNYCAALENVNVAEENAYYSSTDGVLFNKDQTTLIRYPAGKNDANYAIPGSVITVYNWAFGDAVFSDIVIPNSVKKIGTCAFSGCKYLKKVEIPYGVTAIETSAFRDCTSLENIILPDSITTIGSGALRGCSSLKFVKIPRSVTAINTYAVGCSSSGKYYDDFVVCGYSGTVAESYAETNNLQFFDMVKSLGDVDGNGVVDGADYAMLVSLVRCEMAAEGLLMKLRADINGDGIADAFDAIHLDLYLNGVIEWT
ncbi:MAG: leucine-rich repeat protein [Oscillospiraceae bacterium]|nr:leucine-rich repeat protein [Oscillospiraceae bacterium]